MFIRSTLTFDLNPWMAAKVVVVAALNFRFFFLFYSQIFTFSSLFLHCLKAVYFLHHLKQSFSASLKAVFSTSLKAVFSASLYLVILWSLIKGKVPLLVIGDDRSSTTGEATKGTFVQPEILMMLQVGSEIPASTAGMWTKFAMIKLLSCVSSVMHLQLIIPDAWVWAEGAF